jgi:FAD/FMN-containing dehydrogenase
VSISVSGAVGTKYQGFLEDIDDTLRAFAARPHWGKTHFFNAERLQEVYPRYDDFVALRRKMDPDGLFLNEHLRNMVA